MQKYFNQFEIRSELYNNQLFKIVNAQNTVSGEKAIIKLYPSSTEAGLSYIQEEYKIFKSFSPSFNNTFKLESHNNIFALVTEDDDCSSLFDLAKTKPISIDIFFRLARKLALLIKELHKRNVLIKSLNPYSIFFNPITEKIFFGCLSPISFNISKKNEQNFSPNQLPFISPEQTGKIEAEVDERSDIYSLGIILYYLLTGSYPFQSDDPLEIIHAHLAKKPGSLKIYNPEIPSYIEKVILKLLEKSPSKRYQNCSGLLKDISICEDFYKNKSEGKNFQAGKYECYNLIPEGIYGREKEIALLESIFENSQQKEMEMVLISGQPGVGKTAVLEQVIKNHLKEERFIIQAKFDINKNDIPYSAIINAFRSLIQQLLSFDEETILFWTEKLREALSGNERIISNVIPELHYILNASENISPLPPDEAFNRFNQTFINFISAFTNQTHSFILVLDDIQWADKASLNLIERVLENENIKGFVFIGIYRDNEATASSYFPEFLEKSISYFNPKLIKLNCLETEAIETFLSKVLKTSIENIKPLAALAHKKTLGNPFFINQLILSLFKSGFLFFDEEDLQWKWGIEKIANHEIAENVVDFLIDNIKDYDASIIHILKIASCIGDEVDLEHLSNIDSTSKEYILEQMEGPISSGLIVIKETKERKVIDQVNWKTDKIIRIRFSHDRVRQAISTFLEEDETIEIKLKVGLSLLEICKKRGNVEDEIFSIVQNLNYGASLIKSKEDQQTLIELNHKAGIKAQSSNAYNSALIYFNICKTYLNFQNNYKTLFEVYLHAANCQYLSGIHNESEKDLNYLLTIAESNYDKLLVYIQKCHLYTTVDDKEKAVLSGIEALSLFDIHIPTNKLKLTSLILWELSKARLLLPKGKINSLLEKEVLKDEEKVRVAEFMLTLCPPAYQYNQNIFVLLVLKMLNLSLKYGNTGISSQAYIGYGMILSTLFKDYQSGKELAKIAILLNQKLNYTSLKWKGLLSLHNFIIHWTDPIRNNLSDLITIEEGALKNGDPIYAGYAIGIRLIKMFALGLPLQNTFEEYKKYNQKLSQRKDIENQNILLPYYQLIKILVSSNQDDFLKSKSFFNDNSFLNEALKSKSYTVVAEFYIGQTIYSYLTDDINIGIKALREAPKYIHYVNTRYEICLYYLYSSLLLLEILDSPSEGKVRHIKKKVKNNLKQLKTWSFNCPDNFKPLEDIVKAQLEAKTGDPVKAYAYFEQAVHSAHYYNFYNLEALAYELFAKLLRKQGLLSLANNNFIQAQNRYEKWQAPFKYIILEGERLDAAKEATYINHSFSKSKDQQVGLGLEISSIMKLSTAISKESSFEELLERLIKIVIEQSGADFGYLLLKENNELVIKAEYIAEINKVTLITKKPLPEFVPLSVIRYVSRCKESLILQNTFDDNGFSNDPYINERKPQALLCFPILEKNELTGIFYLENREINKIFSQKNLQVLKLLAGSISVSINNAIMKKAQEDHLKDLQKAALEGQEKEKKRIAQDLHDEVGVTLSAARLQLNRLKLKSDLPPESLKISENITGIIDNTINTIRKISRDLLPASLEKIGLLEAIESLCEELNQISEIKVECFSEIVHEINLSKEKEIHLFRIIKEIINNALKHSQATEITVNIKSYRETLLVTVSDNGIGFNIEETRKNGFGLRSIENRARVLDADLNFISQKSEGTKIIITLKHI